jgi:hypothetical protein
VYRDQINTDVTYYTFTTRTAGCSDWWIGNIGEGSWRRTGQTLRLKCDLYRLGTNYRYRVACSFTLLRKGNVFHYPHPKEIRLCPLDLLDIKFTPLLVNFHSMSDPGCKTTSTGASLLHTTSKSHKKGPQLVAIWYTSQYTRIRAEQERKLRFLNTLKALTSLFWDQSCASRRWTPKLLNTEEFHD